MVFQERTYSVLIVTASERFTDSIMPLLPMTDYWPVQTASSVAEARRWLADTEFDIVLINTPLPDDFGMHLAIDICTGSGAGVLLLVKNDHYNEIYSKVVRYGVITLSKPTNRQMVAQNLRIPGADTADAGQASHRRGKDQGDPPGEPGKMAPDRMPEYDGGGGAPVY